MNKECVDYFNKSPLMLFKWANTQGWPVTFVSDNVERFLGYPAKAFIKGEIDYAQIIYPEDLPKVKEEFTRYIHANASSFTQKHYRLVHKDGSHVWIEDLTHSIRDMAGNILYFLGFLSDVTRIKESEAKHYHALSRIEKVNQELIQTINTLKAYKLILDETSILSTSDLEGNITYVNKAFSAIMGYSKEEAIGKPHNILRHPDMPKSVFERMWKTIQNKELWQGMVKNKTKEGKTIYAKTAIMPLLNETREIESYISIRHDITDLIEKSEALKTQAITDPLTGLGNRFKLLIDKEKMERPALAILDIMHFNELNDFYGYTIGDSLIQELASHLERLNGGRFLLYRMYADQFAILADKAIDNDVEEVLHGWHTVLKQTPLHVSDEEVYVNLLFALSFEPQEELLTSVDITKNYAKINNIDFCLYHKKIELAKEYENNLYWQKKLKYALEIDAIAPFFQAIMDVKTQKIEKYEALVRMRLDNEVISPYAFLTIAKKTKQYSSLTRAVIEKSFQCFQNNTLTCSINLTLEDINNKETMEYLWEGIMHYHMKGRVVLEIVESEGIENFKAMEPFLRNAKMYGARIAIDDFGTGYSNFNYLIALQADFIKIDGSLIKRLMDEHSGASDVIKAIVTFAKARSMKTIAEFVCSQEIFEKVSALDIDYAQGYFIAEPKSKEALEL